MVDIFEDIFAALDQLPVEVEILPPAASAASSRSSLDYVQITRAMATVNTKTPAPPPPAPDEKLSKLQVLAMAQEIYGEDRVDLQIINANSYHLYIYFPEFVITDGSYHHTIRGLYTRFIVSHSTISQNLSSCSLSGIRAILTPEEIAYSYGHSHLDHVSAKGQWAEFCQGVSKFKVLFVNLIANPTEDAWRIVLFGLSRYLEWESRDGGPYKNLTDISTPRSQVQAFDFRNAWYTMGKYLPNIFEFTTSLQLVLQSPKIAEFYQEYSPIKTLNQARQSLEQVTADWMRNNRMNMFRFKGQQVTMQVVNGLGVEQSSFVEASVIDGFNTTLTRLLTNFNSQFDYEYARYNNSTSFGEMPSFEQAEINYFKKLARNHRALSRARRKQGVVGGVNHLRKREDNRFGGVGDNS